MIRFLVFVFGFLLALAPSLTQAQDVIISNIVKGSGSPPPAGYTGFGNTITMQEYWGLDAVTAAYRGSKSVQLCNVSDVTCADVNTDGTTGITANAPVIGGVTCGTTVGVDICTAKIVYGQMGSSNMSQATIANRAIFVPSCLGSFPCLRSNAATFYTTTNNIFLSAQPFTYVASAKRTGNTGNETTLLQCFGVANGSMNWANSADTFLLYAGSGPLFKAQTDNTFHTLMGVFNGTSSIAASDASQSTGDAGTGGTSGGGQPCYIMGNNGGGGSSVADFLGGGISAFGATSGNLTTMNTDAHNRWGY